MTHLGEFVDYESLRRALIEVRERRDISLELLNSISGAPDGYFQKIFGPNPTKGIGLRSLGWALGGLGVKGVLIDDQQALARVSRLFVPRDPAHLISATCRWRPLRDPSQSDSCQNQWQCACSVSDNGYDERREYQLRYPALRS
jgi:hypothetical protein